MIVSNYVVYHNRNCDDKYSDHPNDTPNNQSRCLQSSDLLFLNQSAISSAPWNPFLDFRGSPMSRYFKHVPSSSVDNLLAELSIPLADVFALDNFSAHIISSKLTS